MVSHLKIFLEPQEYNALLILADQELRPPADQIRRLLRMELIRRGLLPENFSTFSIDKDTNHSHESV